MSIRQFIQFAPVVGDLAAERKKNLEILGKLASKKPVLDVKRAVNTHIASEERRYGQAPVFLGHVHAVSYCIYGDPLPEIRVCTTFPLSIL